MHQLIYYPESLSIALPEGDQCMHTCMKFIVKAGNLGQTLFKYESKWEASMFIFPEIAHYSKNCGAKWHAFFWDQLICISRKCLPENVNSTPTPPPHPHYMNCVERKGKSIIPLIFSALPWRPICTILWTCLAYLFHSKLGPVLFFFFVLRGGGGVL